MPQVYNEVILALINSDIQRKFLKADKKRYVRSSNDGNVEWIGWKDRHIFPPGASDPVYLFFRPFNVLGDFFGETKLLEWIRKNHLEQKKSRPCYQEQLGFRNECLRELGLSVAVSNELILIPINKAFLRLGNNLRCSLVRQGILNIMFWALDIEAHDTLLESGYLSYFIPGARGSPNRLHYADIELTQMMRNKPFVLIFLTLGYPKAT